MNGDVPLYTTPGDYRPSWFRRNRWWIGVFGGVIFLAGIVSTCGARPGQTQLLVRVVVAEELLVSATPEELTFDFTEPLVEVARDVTLVNASAVQQAVRITLVAGSLTPAADGLLLNSDYRSISGSPHLSCHLNGSPETTIRIEPGQPRVIQLVCRSATKQREGESLARMLITR